MRSCEHNQSLLQAQEGSSGRVVPPLGAGRSPTDEFKRERRMTQFILRPPRRVSFAGLLPNGSAHTFFVVSRIENPVKRFFENNVRRSKDIKKMINRKM